MAAQYVTYERVSAWMPEWFMSGLENGPHCELQSFSWITRLHIFLIPGESLLKRNRCAPRGTPIPLSPISLPGSLTDSSPWLYQAHQLSLTPPIRFRSRTPGAPSHGDLSKNNGASAAYKRSVFA